MSVRRVRLLALRIVHQIVRDRRTLALIVLAPMLMLFLGSLLFRAEQPAIPLGIVNEDQGVLLPTAGRIALGERLVEALEAGEAFSVTTLLRSEIDARLRDGTVQGVVVLPPDFSSGLLLQRSGTIELRLEGSDPTSSKRIEALVGGAAVQMVTAQQGAASGGAPPLTFSTTYLYAGAEFDTMDYIAPAYIAFLAMFFVFLLSCVAFIRERTQGTLERLLATPVTRLEIVSGYMVGLALFALAQVAVIICFAVWVLQIHYLGSLALLFLVVALLALVGVSMGILASAFARNEFQVVQFIPLLIIPQALLSGLFWPVQDMPTYLQPFAYAMPLTYVNFALQDVMLRGLGLAEIWPNLVVLAGFVALLTGLGALTMRREVA